MDQERKLSLQVEFRKLQIDFDQVITEDVIFKFLNEKSSGTFDHSIALQLYQQVVAQFQKLTINNFIFVYIQAEQILKEKSIRAKSDMQNLIESKNETIKILQETQRNEDLNKFGIMEESKLIISKLKTNLNKLNLSMKVFVIIQGNTNSFQTASQNELIWNETYEFPVESGQENIQIIIKAYQGTNTIEIGSTNFIVSQFNSQSETEISLSLQCNKPYSGYVILTGLWIYSKTKFLSETLQSIELKLQQLKEDINDFENDLDMLIRVFPTTISDIYQTSPQKTISFENIEHQSITKYLVAIIVLLITINQLDRCCFFDILIILVYSINYKENNLNSAMLTKIAIATFFSFIIDIGWIIFLLGSLWNDVDTPDMGIKKIITISGVLLFIAKLPFSFLCIYLAKQNNYPTIEVINEDDLSGIQPLEYQNISRNESLSSYQQK